MNPFDELEQKLRSYPDARYERTAQTVRYLPPDERGFTVSVFRGGGQFTVAFAGWHEPFDSEAEALRCFMFGLSERCRLLVLSRGSFDYHWTVQARGNGDWQDDSETGLLFFPFWLRRRERYLQNHVIRDLTVTS